MAAPETHAPATLAREIRLRDAVALVVGGIIGSGIFLVPRSVSQQLDAFLAVLAVWIAGGLLSLAGALSLGELGAAYPQTGGLYVYLREAYGRWAGFVYGWASLLAINTGTIATLGAAMGLYTAQLVPLSDTGQKLVGVSSIAVLTLVNCLGLGPGKWVQNVFTVAKVAGLALVAGLLLWLGQPAEMWSREFLPEAGWGGTGAVVPFFAALVAVLWAYEGWHIISFSAGEFRQPRRDLPRALGLGTLAIVTIYLIVNLAYYAVLPGEEIAQTDTVAATALVQTAGPWAANFVSLLIVVSIFGANNATVLTGPRVLYAMAHEGLFFPIFARVHRGWRTPALAIVAQGAWASLLVMFFGTFQQLFTYVVFTHWIFYAAAVAGVIVLRRRRPELERPYRAPFYPWLPLLFVAAAAGVTASVIAAQPREALWGIAFVLSGVPAYFLFRRLGRATADSSQA